MSIPDGKACCLENECRVIKEAKSQKKLIRPILCRVCNNCFHALCVNYHTKSDSEFALTMNVFSCNKCFQLIEAISEQIYGKFSALINSLQASINDMASEITALKAEAVKSACVTTPALEVDDANDKVPVCTSEETPTNSGNDQNIIISNDNSNADQTNNYSKQPSNNYFLCSIETELSIDDVKFVLDDAKVPLNEIVLKEVDGEFKRKKFIEVSSLNAICLFKFKRAFYSSSLSGSWFLRQTPPKRHNVSEQSSRSSHPLHNKNVHENPTSKNAPNNNYEGAYKNKEIKRGYKKQTFAEVVKNYNNEQTPLVSFKNTPIQPITLSDQFYGNKRNINHLNSQHSQCGPINRQEEMVPFLEKLLLVAKQM